MDRPVAVRAGIMFTIFAVLFAATGMASQVPVAEVLFLIAASLCVLMLAFAMMQLQGSPVPVRARRPR
jgi:hypothetical protein